MNPGHKRLIELVDNNKALMNATVDYIWENPEIGFKEWKTSAYLENEFINLGYRLTRPENIPGFIAEYDTGKPGPIIAVMGELDALICPTHPSADNSTKAVHACGHLIQTAAMLGVAATYSQFENKDQLCGKIRFMAIPAEETIDLEYRQRLIDDGIIHYVAGKIEFLYRGLFDDVDIAMMFHADSREDVLFRVIDGCDGCITKHFEYEGVASHAGGAPNKGINAMYAASIGLQACNSLRETFVEKDYVRYHPIITQAGVAANAIPGKAYLDAYVRASGLETMVNVNRKINRAIAASAASIGANVIMNDKPGNLPFINNKDLITDMEAIIEELFGTNQVVHTGWDTQSSDVGDICSLIPVIQPHCMGAAGEQHGEDYFITDREKAVINPAKVMSCLIYNLLIEDAHEAYRVIKNYEPVFSDKEEYFNTINKIERTDKLVCYNPDGTITLLP